MNKFVVYCLYDIRTNLIFYDGKFEGKPLIWEYITNQIDIPKKEADHCCDATRYGLMFLKDKRDLSRAAINVGYW